MRNRKGFSQAELSEKTGSSLETIQKIENGELEPQGDEINRLASALEISPDELVSWKKQENKKFLVHLNLSALWFILFPLFGILVPFIIWNYKKDRSRELNDLAKELLNFQMTWFILLFIGNFFIFTACILTFLNSRFDNPSGASHINVLPVICFVGIMWLYNIIMIIVNTGKIKNDKTAKYYPKIRFIRS